MPLIDDPKLPSWKSRVFSQYPREGSHMGYSMRTDRYRYTEWVLFEYAPEYKPDWTKVNGTELYDHAFDPVRICTYLCYSPTLTAPINVYCPVHMPMSLCSPFSYSSDYY
jgi:hypothetical protein